MTIAQNFDANWDLSPDGCHIWRRACKGKEVASGGGYGCLNVGGKCVGAHVFAWERVHGPVPKGMQVMHSCHNTKCVNVAHLSLGTNAKNQADKAAALRAPHKLSVEAVKSIKARVASGELQRVVAKDNGIHQADVSNIINGKYWCHVA